MKRCLFLTFMSILFLLPKMGKAQGDKDKLGAWYMYFFNTTFKESSLGMQGDIQYRNWNIAGDLEQLLLRGGITYIPASVSSPTTLCMATLGASC